MSHPLTTARLQLRPSTTADIDDLHRLWTNPGVRKYLWDDEVILREVAAEVVASSLADFAAHGFGHWVAMWKDQSELIGWAGLRRFGEPPEVEVLYGFFPEFWGQGLAVEATRAILRFGFEEIGLERIYAGTDPPNTASVRVMEKAGMRFDKRTQINGLEAIYYVISRADYRA
ncbi:MAG TPA: GNAT family N-acetyltransferase [Blastocatellia bacterium]|nr:GNAT family N-acetyltransferase [Blastocatellia bacterium]